MDTTNTNPEAPKKRGRRKKTIVYDPSKTIELNELEQMRSTPQETINYLLARKNKYKRTAYKEFDRANKAEKNITNVTAELNWWKNAFWISIGSLVGLIFAMIVISIIPKDKPIKKQASNTYIKSTGYRTCPYKTIEINESLSRIPALSAELFIFC